MPALGSDQGILKPEEIHQVASYVRTLSKLEPEPGVDVAAGKKIFADNCAVYLGVDGKGNTAMGSANLTDGSSFPVLTLKTSSKRSPTHAIARCRPGALASIR